MVIAHGLSLGCLLVGHSLSLCSIPCGKGVWERVGGGGVSRSDKGGGRRDGQMSKRINGNLQLVGVEWGISLGHTRDQRWGRLPGVNVSDLSRDTEQCGYGTEEATFCNQAGPSVEG